MISGSEFRTRDRGMYNLSRPYAHRDPRWGKCFSALGNTLNETETPSQRDFEFKRERQ
jgi:hypothetical protein